MNNRYFFTIKFLPAQADCALLAGRCIKTLHGFMAVNEAAANKVGICFPKWNDRNIGSAIGFVCHGETTLTGLSYQPYFTLMRSEGLFEISPVKTVPEAAPEVRFVRNQTIDKSFPDSKRRRLRRAEKRAIEAGRDFTPVSEEERTFLPFHSIPMGSKSSGKDFALQVQVEDEEEPCDGGYNMYGLATNKMWRGTVPLIEV